LNGIEPTPRVDVALPKAQTVTFTSHEASAYRGATVAASGAAYTSEKIMCFSLIPATAGPLAKPDNGCAGGRLAARGATAAAEGSVARTRRLRQECVAVGEEVSAVTAGRLPASRG
jgi:hypothetical protein